MQYPDHPPRRRSGGLLIFLVLVLPFGLLVLPTTVMLLAGLIPTVVAYIVDRDPDKPACLSVAAMNLCGIMPFLIKLWREGHTADLAFGLLAQPTTWLVMYGAAGIGWGIYYLVPPIVTGLSVSRDEATIRQLEEQRALLVKDWGPEVAGKPDGADAPGKDGAADPAGAEAARAPD
ncbi:MAG: hypothetical protein RLY86_3227 [Pseudomonadota bacterium]|jgi:hypothetical protein